MRGTRKRQAMAKNYRAERKRLGIPKGMRRNPDGSYEGFVSAEDANRMMRKCMEEGHRCAIACAKKKWERTQEIIKAINAEDAQ